MLTLIEKSIDTYFATRPRRLASLESLQSVKLIAHRGAHDKTLMIIENTHQAFEHAKALGCWGIELDIHATKDHILVVNHDATLKRLHDVEVSIGEVTFERLRKLAPNVPSLKEVVERYGKIMHLFIELKTPFNHETELMKTLSPLIAGEDYHLLSLNEHLFESFQIAPKACMLLVADYNNAKHFCHLSLEKQYGGVLGHYLLLTDKIIQQLRHQHQKAGIGFINSRFSLYRELNRGLDWIFTDQAKPVSERLQQMKNSRR